MTGRTDKPAQDVTAIRGGAVTLAEAADAFLSSPRTASANTRRAHAGAIDRLAAELGPHRPLAAVSGDEIAAALRHRWGHRALATWNRNREAVLSWLTWCASRKRWPAPSYPATPSGARSTATPPGHCPGPASSGCCPAAEHFLVAAPAGPLDKDGPGFETAWQAAASAAGARPENQAGILNGRRFRIPALRSAPFRGSGLLRLQGVRLGS